MIETVKRELRITSTAFDEEVMDLIEAAFADLRIPPIKADKLVETEPLIKRAVILYCKAYFGLDNQDSEKYIKSYDNLVQKLSLSLIYKDVVE
jgi:uncharacterized phage protein (predicted DNA packaging)